MPLARIPPVPAAAFAVLLLGAAPAGGQTRDCQLTQAERSVTRGSDENTRVSRLQRPVFICEGGTRIRADSSIHNHGPALHRFFGNVEFVDGGRRLMAPFAQYFARTGRLDARDGVQVVTLETGDTIQGGELTLLRANDARPEDVLTVRRGRPTAVFHTGGSVADEPGPSGADSAAAPYRLVADVIHLVGESLLAAKGRVQIERNALQAFGDSTEFDQAEGRLRLYRAARIVQDSLDVRGDTVDVLMPSGVLETIESVSNARMRASGVNLEGYYARALFAGDALERVVVLRRPPSPVDQAQGEVAEEGVDDPRPPLRLDLREDVSEERPDSLFPPALARSDKFRITGDSIEVDAPNGELERVYAVGTAKAESIARDSLNAPRTPVELRTDWLAADTVIATFLASAADDGADSRDQGEYRLDTLLGRVNAKSFYRVVSRDTTLVNPDAEGKRALELNYTLGDEIRIFLNASAEVDSMNVANPRGAYFQPNRRAAPTPVDTSSVARPDTVKPAPPDTTGAVRPDTLRRPRARGRERRP